MYEVTFELETITPLFMSGADRNEVELRPSTFKGMMRFWWRAVRAIDDTKELWKEEAALFGAAEEKFGKSKVVFMVVPGKISIGHYKPLPHHTGDNKCPFLPSCKGKYGNCSKGFRLLCIHQGSYFKVILKSSEKKKLDIYKDMFVISTLLGGFGKRSRRGFGSITIKRINNSNFYLPSDLEGILNLLTKFNVHFVIQSAPPTKKIANHLRPSSNYPWIREIYLGRTTNDVHRLLRKISKASHDHRDNSLGYAVNERLASAIFVSVIQDKDGYRPIITVLNYSGRKKANFRKQNDFVRDLL